VLGSNKEVRKNQILKIPENTFGFFAEKKLGFSQKERDREHQIASREG
jgi:hypothetical protein